MKKRYIVEIEVDEENIKEKYPNYRFNYSNPKEFINSLMKDFTIEGDTDMSKEGFKKWGYSKKIIKEIKNELWTRKKPIK